MSKITALSVNDMKSITREPLLMGVSLAPIITALVFRFLVPAAAGWLEPYFDLKEYYTLIAGMYILITPMLMGMVEGFILLDERDDNTLTALMVTPMPRAGYIAYRASMGMVLSIVYTILFLPVINLVDIPMIYTIPVAFIAALEAPVAALFLGAFAGNKVEGLALSKVSGLLMSAPFVIYFLPSKWQIAVGILPSYWPVKAMDSIVSGYGGYWLYVAGGVAVHLLILYLLFKRFSRRIV